MIQSICPNCGNKKMFSDDKSGKKYKCPNCSEVVTIESIGTAIVNEHQANVTNTYAASIEQAEENNRIAALNAQHQKLLSKSKVWNGWGTFFYILAGVAIIMVISEKDFSQVISIAFWGGLGAWFKKKSKEFKEQADELYRTHFGSTSQEGNSEPTQEEQPNIVNYVNEQSNNTSKVMSVNSKGALDISFPGQWFLVDAKTKIYVNENLHSTHSTKEGFKVSIPLTSDKLKLKLVLGGMKTTTYDLEELDLNKSYKLELQYSDTWGRYSNKFNLIENG